MEPSLLTKCASCAFAGRSSDYLCATLQNTRQGNEHLDLLETFVCYDIDTGLHSAAKTFLVPTHPIGNITTMLLVNSNVLLRRESARRRGASTAPKSEAVFFVNDCVFCLVVLRFGVLGSGWV